MGVGGTDPVLGERVVQLYHEVTVREVSVFHVEKEEISLRPVKYEPDYSEIQVVYQINWSDRSASVDLVYSRRVAPPG